MEKTEIINRLQKVKTLKGFAKLLNDIKRDEFGTGKYKITEKQLRHFCSPNIFADRYRAFKIRKKSGGVREINAPCYQLKVILYILNKVFQAVYIPGKAAMGFTEGRSVVTNAYIHTGHHYVFNIDLENFFPSIPQARVWKRLQLPPFNFSIEIANVVAGLCCHKNEDGTKNVLPQGAATSPILTNAICDNLDRRMLGVARHFGLHYSRYADDMTFSSMHNVYQNGSDFRKEILRIITEQGFTLNEKKTRLQRTGERQEVTGLTVNETVNVARKYVRDLRCILHVWEKEGYGKAYAYFYPKYKRDKGYIKKGEPVMENVVEGKLNYLRMVKGASNAAYLKLLERFNKLQTLVYLDKETDKGESYIYVHSYSLKEFEELFQTAVGLIVSKKGNLIGKCEIAGTEKVIAVSKSTQKKLCKNLADKAPDTAVTSEALNQCFVTLCRAKGKNHWLITKGQMQRSKCLSILNAKIDIDYLLLIWEKQGLEHAVSAFQSCVGGSSINSISLDDILKNHGISDLESIDNDSIKTIWETDGDNMEQKDLQEFIYFLTRNKTLTRGQQHKRDRLLARDYSQKEIQNNKKTKSNDKQIIGHAPKETASFLSLFNVPNGFKFLTHDFDPNSDLNYDKLMAQVRAQFKEATVKYRIPKNLYALLSVFINGGIDKEGKARTWMDCDGKFHKENYTSKEWEEWSRNNPNAHLLSNEKIGNEILKFRSSIRLIKPVLCDIINRQATKHSNLIIQTDGLEKADFYTYVWALENGIKRILDDMARYADKTPRVLISFERSFGDDYSSRIIKITQLDSKSSSIDDVLKKFKTGGGAFNEIKKVFYGYCNWSVESLWDGKPKRWNILSDTNVEETEDVKSGNVLGFTHILTYFSK